jgi:hypothetical protein
MGFLDKKGATLDKQQIAGTYGSKLHAEGVVYDKQDQLDKVADRLLPDEHLEAVYDGAGLTGYVGITNKQLIVAHRKDVTSIPYSRISAVKADGGWFSSKLVVYLAGRDEYQIELHDGKKALHAHNLMLAHMLA